MWYALVTAGAIICAVGAIRANRLLASALWLAGSSALVALLIYLLGAPEVAVVELSVGAGLVTVLFVFAINIAGEEALEIHSLVPRPLAIGLVATALLLIGWLSLPRMLVLPSPVFSEFSKVLWEERGLDVLIQVVIIFAGVLGVLGLLADGTNSKTSEAEVHS
ncbi:MAG: NADH-quinone oxidoreductase subunit J [Anaerolineaceae bacterium]|nr:NADH-quinone oxidoreductase subunit J [Anaerolineaceae bacterium]